jgi:hypothetical protein
LPHVVKFVEADSDVKPEPIPRTRGLLVEQLARSRHMSKAVQLSEPLADVVPTHENAAHQLKVVDPER